MRQSRVCADVSGEAIARKHADAFEAANGAVEPVCCTDSDARTNNCAAGYRGRDTVDGAAVT